MKLGISSKKVTDKYGFEKGLKLIKQGGFDTVDVSFTSYGKGGENDIYQKSEDEFLSYFYNFKKTCDELELEVSQTHGRLTTCVPDKEEQNFIKKISELDLKASQILKSPVCVFHNAKLRQFEDVSTEGEFILEKNKEFFEGFLDPLCQKYGVKFGLETHGKTMVKEKILLDYLADANNLLKSFNDIKSDYKTICFDTGHCNEAHFYGAPTVCEAVKILGKNISVLHLHDNDGVYDSHLMPYSGACGVDWTGLFDLLDEAGYNGTYNWELGLSAFGDYLDKSLEFIGKFLRYFIENKGRIK